MCFVAALFAVLSLVTKVASLNEVSTRGEFEATYFPLKTSLIKFQVKSTKDANVIMTKSTNPNLDVDPFIEIVIGGNNNAESVVRRKRPHLFGGANGREKVIVATPGILNGQEFRGFWLKIEGNSLLLGKEPETVPFMVWTDSEAIDYPFIGVSSCCGATAEWKINSEEPTSNNGRSTNLKKELHTGGNFEYIYSPLKSSNTLIHFKVKTAKDASLILTDSTKPNLDIDHFYEIVIGGLNNVHSVIRTKRPHLFVGSNREKVLVDTPRIVSENEFRGFWLRIDGDTLMVGKQNEKSPFMMWSDSKPINKKYYGVASCCGATADWEILEGSFSNDNGGTRTHQGNKQFILDENLKTWDEAKATCEEKGMRLASVRSKQEQVLLEEAIKNSTNPFSGVWLSANDRGRRGQFVWHDGSNELVNFANWEFQRVPMRDPSSKKQCVFASYVALVVKNEAFWYLQQCDDTWNFVCEFYS